MAKTALIVDDSASARLVLGRMLAEQDLTVDTAASGEEALEYLRQGRPDVIFMDHLMPGMDGFQALEAIKENPATATIPVMMYTSEKGELYVGQARALGAFGVLPKQVQPVEVTKVLKALHLIPATEEDVSKPPAAAELESRRVSALLEDLFDQQRAVLRDEIRRGYERLAETTVETKRLSHQGEGLGVRSVVPYVLAAVLGLSTVTFAYLYFETSALLAQANDRIQLLIAPLHTQPASAEAEAVDGTPIDRAMPELLGLIELAANQGGIYPFGEIALDADRAALFGSLVERLSGLGFTGTVAVDVHVGRYCMNVGADGALRLPPPEQGVEACQQLGWPEPEALSLAERQSLPFANAIALATRGTDIEVQIVSHGSAVPQRPYPVFTQGLTAGEWNEVAARNQRVEVRILPE